MVLCRWSLLFLLFRLKLSCRRRRRGISSSFLRCRMPGLAHLPPSMPQVILCSRSGKQIYMRTVRRAIVLTANTADLRDMLLARILLVNLKNLSCSVCVARLSRVR